MNDTGRADAKAVGEVFKAAGIPIGKCYSSRFQRAVGTARLIGGKERSGHEHARHHPQAEHPRRVREGLVRDQRGRGVDLQARERKVRDGRPRADRPVDGGI